MLTAAECVNLESPGFQSRLNARENRAAILLVLVLVLVLENPGKIEDEDEDEPERRAFRIRKKPAGGVQRVGSKRSASYFAAS